MTTDNNLLKSDMILHCCSYRLCVQQLISYQSFGYTDQHSTNPESYTYRAVSSSPTINTNASQNIITSPSIHTETSLRAIYPKCSIKTAYIAKNYHIKSYD